MTSDENIKAAEADDLIRAICHKHKVSPLEFRSLRRNGYLIPARIEAAKILRARGMSYPAIGRAMNRDHSSIVYLVKKP